MGRGGFLLAVLVVLFFLTCVRFHPSDSGWIRWFSVEIVSPFR